MPAKLSSCENPPGFANTLSRVLIVHPWGVGDWVMFSPLLRSLYQCNPSVQIDVILLNSALKDFVESYTGCRVIYNDDGSRSKIRVYWGLIKQMIKVQVPYDLAIFSTGVNSIKAEFLSVFLPAKRKAAIYNRKAILRNIDYSISYDFKKSQAENCLQLVGCLGLPAVDALYIPCGNQDKRVSRSVLIHPGCDRGNLYKRWGIENYIALGEMLIAQGYYVGFIIGPSEQEYVSRLSESESRFVVHQDLDFASLVRTIASYEILINNDSGVGHIAAGLGLKIVSLYGPTDPNLYKPLSSKIKIIQKLPVMACMPCYDKNRSRYGCSLKPCMADITVDRVLESVLSFNE